MEWLAPVLFAILVMLSIAIWWLGISKLHQWAPPAPVTIGIAVFFIVYQIADSGFVEHGEWITIPIGILIDVFLIVWLYWWWQDRKYKPPVD